ncbi:hypothetical protein [Oceanicola sp. 22II-s10i]|nr:hypothetical protein [Oceanicola sp. 22II-s10i]
MPVPSASDCTAPAIGPRTAVREAGVRRVKISDSAANLRPLHSSRHEGT